VSVQTGERHWPVQLVNFNLDAVGVVKENARLIVFLRPQATLLADQFDNFLNAQDVFEAHDLLLL
jgi:hypothetical protein